MADLQNNVTYNIENIKLKKTLYCFFCKEIYRYSGSNSWNYIIITNYDR